MRPRIRKKKKKNQIYYYIVTSERTGPNKQPRERILEYIGTLDNLLERFIQSYVKETEAVDTPSLESLPKKWGFKGYVHGSVMALFWLCRLLGLEEIMDTCFSNKTIKGLPRSRVLLLEMIHRADQPGSMSTFHDWISTTSLSYHLGQDFGKLTAQDIWEAMDGITEDQIVKANAMLVDKIRALFPTEFDRLHLDYTNYHTWISSRNNQCTICYRGHNKQKRDDLRQFSLAVITCPELQIPLVWDLYEGNKNDKAEFPDFVKQVEAFIQRVQKNSKDVTVTFDGGSNSKESLTNLAFNFICAHSMEGMKELYDIDLSQYTEVTLSNGSKRLAYRVDNLEFSGITGTGILTFSEDLKNGEVAELEKAQGKFEEMFKSVEDRINNPMSSLQKKLNRARKDMFRLQKEIDDYNKEVQEERKKLEASGKKPRGRQKAEKTVPVWDPVSAMQQIVEDECYSPKKDLKEYIKIKVELKNDQFKASYCLNKKDRDSFINRNYGKKLTCTNHLDWTTERILSAYVDQECIERLFRTSKSTEHFSVRPQFHWTDDKIRVHVYECMTVLSLAETLCLLLKSKGVSYSKEQLIERLSCIRDGWVLFDKMQVQRVLEDMDKDLECLWNVVCSIFDEDKEAPLEMVNIG